MAPGLGCVVSCDTSPISVLAILRPALRLSSSWKFTALCYNRNRHHNSLNLPGDSTLVLHNDRHIPELSRPLISVGQLDEADIRAGFSSGGWTLHRGNLLLARGPKVHSLYPLCHPYGTNDLDTSARSVSRTYPEPVTSRNSPSQIISFVSIASTANK